MLTPIRKLILILFLVLVFALTQGCAIDQVLKMGESGSKSYGVIKNANSLGDVAKGIVKLSDTRKIKAETHKNFVKGIEMLISNQPLETQGKLISQSIEAKVSIESSRVWGSWGIITSFSLSFLGLIIILKYIFDRWKPKVSKTIITNE